MTRPFLLAQLSDLHLGAEWGGGDPTTELRAAVESIRRLPDLPDAVIVTGDVSDHGAGEEYSTARGLLARLGSPVHVLPGNHDDRRSLRAEFALPGDAASPIDYAVDLGPIRLVALDSTRPGEDPGGLDPGQLTWLDEALERDPVKPALLALHHPPLITGIPPWDQSGLAEADARALGGVLARHPQVRSVAAGHLHRTLVGEFAGRPVLVSPSTYVQMLLDFGASELQVGAGPPGFVIHALHGDRLISHVQPIG